MFQKQKRGLDPGDSFRALIGKQQRGVTRRTGRPTYGDRVYIVQGFEGRNVRAVSGGAAAEAMLVGNVSPGLELLPRSATAGLTVHVADLTSPNIDAYRHHFAGAHAVIHLGRLRSPDGLAGALSGPTWDSEHANVVMAHNVYQVAMEEGVRRAVVASSNHAADCKCSHSLCLRLLCLKAGCGCVQSTSR